MAVPRILIVGDVINDIIVKPRASTFPATDNPSEIRRTSGGSASNQAAWAARFGADVAFVGRVGARDVGSQQRFLESLGIRAHLVADEACETGTIVVLLDDVGERTMYVDRGANARLGPGDVDRRLLERVDWLHLTGYLFFSASGRDLARDLVRWAREARIGISVDPSSAYHLGRSEGAQFLASTRGFDLCIPNEDEARALTGADDPAGWASALLEVYGTCVVKRGPRGAVVLEPDASPVEVPVVRAVRAIDTTGAGDAFAGGLLTALLCGSTMVEASAIAVASAGEAITRLGGKPDPDSRPDAIKVEQ